MRNKIYINISSLYITILGKDILESSEQIYDIVKATNRNLILLEALALFISIRNIYTRDFE